MKYIPIRIIFDGSPFSYLQSAKGPRVLRNSMKTASDDLLSPIETTLGGAWAKVWRVIKGYTNKITYLTRFHCMGRGRLKIMSNSWGIPHTGTEKSDKVCIMLLVHLIPQNYEFGPPLGLLGCPQAQPTVYKMCHKSPGTPLKASSAHICPRTFETYFCTRATKGDLWGGPIP